VLFSLVVDKKYKRGQSTPILYFQRETNLV